MDFTHCPLPVHLDRQTYDGLDSTGQGRRNQVCEIHALSVFDKENRDKILYSCSLGYP